MDTVGAPVSTTKSTAAELAEALPAGSVATAVRVRLPSAGAAMSMDHVPPDTVAVPADWPSMKISTLSPSVPVPVTAIGACASSAVTRLSPVTASIPGTSGATVSTVISNPGAVAAVLPAASRTTADRVLLPSTNAPSAPPSSETVTRPSSPAVTTTSGPPFRLKVTSAPASVWPVNAAPEVSAALMTPSSPPDSATCVSAAGAAPSIS